MVNDDKYQLKKHLLSQRKNKCLIAA